MTSRIEASLQRLLSSTETLAADEDNLKGLGFWRLERYVGELQSKLLELQNAKCCEADAIAGYSKRISFLLNLIDQQASALSNSCETYSPPISSGIRQRLVHKSSLSPGASPIPNFLCKQSTPGSAKGTEIKLKVASRHETNMRQELFGKHENEERQLQQDETETIGNFAKQEDLEVILKRHNEMQEQIAEDMIRMARNMKDHQLVAKKIILEDNKTLTESGNMADKNYDRLKRETERVQEHTRKSCSCWIWLMLAIVCMVFIGVVLFIRIIPK